MVAIHSPNPTSSFKRLHRGIGIQCCSGIPEPDNSYKSTSRSKTPQVLKLAVNGVTELLRLFSPTTKDNRLESGSKKDRSEIYVSSVDDVLMVLKSDYDNAYFVTGVFTSAIYDKDCVFEDPTIKFQGTELYSRNLKLLVPFFDCASIELQNIEKDVNSTRDVILATWKLRTYLKFPWRPLISIDGRTVYELDNTFKIVRHAERWSVSALEAIGQIFTPSMGRSSGD